MARYRVTKPSLIENRLVAVGTIVEYDGIPGSNLEPLDGDGKKRKEDHDLMRRRAARSPEEKMGEAIAKGMSSKPEDEPDKGKDKAPKVVQAAGDDALTTVGHSSVSQKSAGGVDAEHLLESDGKGGLVPQNPHSDAKPATEADSPDDGKPKGNGDLITGVGTGDREADDKAVAASRDADRKAAAAKQTSKGKR
jgi:hypothetical protein